MIESVSGAFPFFNLFIACLTLPKVGSLTVIASMMSLSSDSYTLSLKTGFSGSPLLSTSFKCPVHHTCTSSFLLRFPFLSNTAVLCLGFSLHNILVSPYSVFMCWFLAASSAPQVMFSSHFFLSVFICLFTSLVQSFLHTLPKAAS